MGNSWRGFTARGGGGHVKHLWADGGYAGTLVARARKMWRCTVEIIKRTFGWLGYRQIDRDYERHMLTGEAMIHVAMIRLMLARLACYS